MNVNPLNDAENIRRQRNLTDSQRKNSTSTKEGVVVNNNIGKNNLSASRKTYLISTDVKMPENLYSDNSTVDKKLIPLSGIALGVMSVITLITALISRSAKAARNLPKEKWLPAVTRNVNLSKETSQIIYQMVQSPNKKTFIAAGGVLALSAMAFMGKTFFDGYKDIWVKRKEANIQKNLQESLVNVETNAFSGKIQIVRSMLSKYANDFENYLISDNEPILPNFGKVKYLQSFTSSKNETSGRNSNWANIMLGAGTAIAITVLGYLSLKNLTRGKKYLQENLQKVKDTISSVVNSSDEYKKDTDKITLEYLFTSLDGTDGAAEFISGQINKLKWNKQEEKNEFLHNILTRMKTSTIQVNPNIGGDGTPRPAFNSFVDDYRAFFYNWLIDTDNPQFKQLFLGITGVTAVSYGGKLAGDAIKEVQVKKINAETELELQKRLVSTELRNFKSKKDAAVLPLVEEFYRRLDNGKCTKEELKTMAENILSEIKNGPPYVYS